MIKRNTFTRAASLARRDGRIARLYIATHKPGTLAHAGWSIMCALDAARERLWSWLARKAGSK